MTYWFIKSTNVPGTVWTKEGLSIDKPSEIRFTFDYPYSNDIFSSSPFTFVTRIIKDMSHDDDILGAEFIKVETEISQDYIDRFGDATCPETYLLQPSGVAFKSDVFAAWDNRVVISDKFLKLLKTFNVNELEVLDVTSEEVFSGKRAFPNNPRLAAKYEENVYPKWRTLMSLKPDIN